MATIDINQYIEQSGMRKARFGGYEPDDVRQAMLDLCSDYEQRLNTAAQQVRGAQQEAEALRRRFVKVLRLRKNDYSRYSLFGFLYTETPENQREELDYIASSDLMEFASF